ncbi:MAG: hypothetical protein JWN70_2881 [Planctomycetaceae bacterium]|nr:hypothetical protein [Planctomycetaceae bacterium]
MGPIYLFLYRVKFSPSANPPATISRFEADLKLFLKARHLRSIIGSQGGCTYSYGVVYRKRWGVKEADRVALAEWIKVQRIRGTAMLGDLEEDTEETELVREITEWVFKVDNLTQENRQAAAAYQREIKKWTRQWGKDRQTNG